MRRAMAWAGRAGVALAVVLAGAAAGRAQSPSITIKDARVVEGTAAGPGYQDVTLEVTLNPPNPNTVPIDVPWKAVDGSAVGSPPAPDFDSAAPYGSGTLSFGKDIASLNLTVRVVMDDIGEWSPTLQQDEVFFVDLGPCPCGDATIKKGRATVTILDDDHPLVGERPGLQFVSVVSDGTVTDGRNRLQWRVPAALAQPTDVLIAWNYGSSCSSPVDDQPASAQGQQLVSVTASAGETQAWVHLVPLVPLMPGTVYCYSLFAVYSGSITTTEMVTIKAKPFDTAGPVKWSYSAGSTVLAPPTVGDNAVYTVSTDGVVHAMQRGDTGGPWPTTWNPVALGKAAHNRSPVVPLAAGSRLFVGTEQGEVHAVDGTNGSIVWSRSQPFGATQLPNAGGVQATPAGLFKSWGGLNDMILVGTNNGTAGNNTFYALDPDKGVDLSTYTSASMGSVRSMAVVDYPGNRVFFATTSTSATLWGLDLSLPNLGLSSPGWNPWPRFSSANGSAVLRSGRLYVGTSNGAIHAIRVSDGGFSSTSTLGDGEVKGFMFPDRRNGYLYFSTNSNVWGFEDTLEPLDPLLSFVWSLAISSPSIVLHRPDTDYLYVGSDDGKLYEIYLVDRSTKSVPLEPLGVQIGAPSLDWMNDLVLVGSTNGVIYAVHVPF